MEVQASNRQTLFDLAIQYCGSVEAAVELAALNGLSVTDELPTGQVLTIPLVYDKRVAEYYRINSLRPATEVSSTDNQKPQGIGYWAIGVDFIVS